MWQSSFSFLEERVADPSIDTWIYPNFITPTNTETVVASNGSNDSEYDVYGFDDTVYELYFYVDRGDIDFNEDGRFINSMLYFKFVFPVVFYSCRLVDNFYHQPFKLNLHEPFISYDFSIVYSATTIPTGLSASDILLRETKQHNTPMGYIPHEYNINGNLYYAIDFVPMSVLPKVVADYLNLITYQYIQAIGNPPIENFIKYSTKYWILYKYRSGVFIKTEPPNLHYPNDEDIIEETSS